MRQVFLEKGHAIIKQISKPLLDDYAVLVSVKYSFISAENDNSDLINMQKRSLLLDIPQKIKKLFGAVESYDLSSPYLAQTSTVQAIGYSCSGVVVAVGKKVQDVRVGDLVACAGKGYAQYADIVCIPEHLLVLITQKKYLPSASVTTAGARALQGIRRASLQLGETVAVVGLGLLGQLTVQLARVSGCTVIGIDSIDERLNLANRMGADRVLHVQRDNVEKEVCLSTAQHGADVTIITGTVSAGTSLQQAIEITRKKGRVVLVGDIDIDINRNLFYTKEIDFLTSCSYGPGRYDVSYEEGGRDYPYAYVRWTENRNMQAFVSLIEREQIDIMSLISKEIPATSLDLVSEPLQKKGAIGVLLSYADKKNKEFEGATASHKGVGSRGSQFVPAVYGDSVRIGMVGVGRFAQRKLLPLLSKMKAVKINAIVDANVSNSIAISQKYAAATALVNDEELFHADLVDAVVIASPHKFHCDQALRALQNGKAVFLEKPMVTDFQQLDRLMNFLMTHPHIPFCIDYNRSFSPLVQKIKKVVDARVTPLVVQYRMNVGFIPREQWIQTDIGSGRIIGEACHIFDLFCYLTDARPLVVSVESLHRGNMNLFPTDNFSVQIGFSDGSICSLMYTALGHKDLGKERMELFFDSKSIVMDDYDYLKGFGLSKSFDEMLDEPDKGYDTLLNRFFSSVKNNTFSPLVSLDRLRMVAELTLVVDALACQGGGKKELP